jgi:hypothetical protein
MQDRFSKKMADAPGFSHQAGKDTHNMPKKLSFEVFRKARVSQLMGFFTGGLTG